MVTFLPFASCKGQDFDGEEVYQYKSGDLDGIGKWYMGREIAHVMGFQGIDWLERESREKEEKTSKLLKNMKIEQNDVIADIGAGSGYHVFKMAPLASKVFAVDIQEEMLESMRERKEKLEAANVNLVLGSEKTINLPSNSVDKILMVDVYHEFAFPAEIIASVKEALKKDGALYLIEYRSEDLSVPIKKAHKMSEAQAVKEMKAAGLVLDENISNLPWQHCMIFKKAQE